MEFNTIDDMKIFFDDKFKGNQIVKFKTFSGENVSSRISEVNNTGIFILRFSGRKFYSFESIAEVL